MSNCQKIMCHTDNCICIDHMYNTIVESIKHASLSFIKKIRRDKFKVTPGWNRAVKGSYSISKENYIKGGLIYVNRDQVRFMKRCVTLKNILNINLKNVKKG